jgi:hypothetical protein
VNETRLHGKIYWRRLGIIGQVFPFCSLLNDDADQHVEELIALAGDYRVARVAFDKAVRERPGRIHLAAEDSPPSRQDTHCLLNSGIGRSMPREQRSDSKRSETSLYGPVKGYLEALGFTVKGEVCGCDLVALRGDEPPMVVVGELKLSFSLDLVLQAVDRTAVCDEVWLAVNAAARGRLRDPRVRKLCRLLGFGLLGVSPTGAVELLIEPKPWRPRRDSNRHARLVNEHRRRIGDPSLGGSTRQPVMTAYRQQALACAASLAEGPRRTSDLRPIVPNAANILLRNVYGWFTRTERGVYKLTSEGDAALARWGHPSPPDL